LKDPVQVFLEGGLRFGRGFRLFLVTSGHHR
jgi:hypothetical protein